jgi:hypothetical protein
MKVLACAGAALLSIGPAIAQDAIETYPRRSFGAWSVYGFQGDCWMVKDGIGGASIALSTNPGDSDLYIAVENPAWTEIAGDIDIDVRLSFTGFDAVRPASGLAKKGRGFSLFLSGGEDSHLAALQAAPRLRLAAPNLAIDVPLADAGPAFDYMRQCTKEIRK